jgi:hypothetical protein
MDQSALLESNEVLRCSSLAESRHLDYLIYRELMTMQKTDYFEPFGVTEDFEITGIFREY